MQGEPSQQPQAYPQDVNVQVQQQPQPQYLDNNPQTFSQPTNVPPSASQTSNNNNQAKATGLNGESLTRVFTSAQGVLRLFELLFAMIAFGAMSDTKGYDNFDQFKFLVAAGVMTFIYLLFIIPAYIFDLHAKTKMLYLIEMIIDALLAFFNFIAGIVTAAKCNESIPGGHLCDNAEKAKAAAAFAFLLCFCLCFSFFLSFRQWRANGR